MNEYIYNRLNLVENLEERKLLRNILTGVFTEIVNHNDSMYNLLAEQIYNEYTDPQSNFDIYTTLVNIKQADPISEIYTPIIPEDIEGTEINLLKLTQEQQEKGQATLCPVYMEANYRIIKRIQRTNQTYTGKLITKEKETKNFEFKLTPKTDYIDKIKQLYELYNYNRKAWKTLNIPYAYRYFNINITSDIPYEEGEEIESFIINLREYDKYKRFEKIPLWNISRQKQQDKTFPLPAKDHINYEHKIAIEDPKTPNGYLLDYNDNQELTPIEYIKRQKKELTIITNTDQQLDWNLLRINNIKNKQQEWTKYNSLSNAQNKSFTENYANSRMTIIRTKAELTKHITSYAQSKDLNYQGIEITDNYTGKHYTYNLNPFIEDNIREEKTKQTMILKFKPIEKDDYLIYDKISFITTEVQTIFPEYKCIGELT